MLCMMMFCMINILNSICISGGELKADQSMNMYESTYKFCELIYKPSSSVIQSKLKNFIISSYNYAVWFIAIIEMKLKKC